MVGTRVVVVDDDTVLAALVCKALSEDGQHAEWARSSAAADIVSKREPHVLVLSWPRDEALAASTCAALKKQGRSLLLVTTADRRMSTTRAIFDAGADDMLRKPFAIAELLLRVRALGRRGPGLRERPLRAGRIEIDPEARSMTVDGKPVRLTQREFLLIKHLVTQAGRVVSRAELARAVWGGSAPPSNVVVAHASHLRTKLGSAGAQLRAIRGAGYLLDCEEAS
ncbi:MAG: response regulator transcription factor [Polyangiaceae bacterium]|nr:response regulator transcription factor [Polyangiaceae bacterium]